MRTETITTVIESSPWEFGWTALAAIGTIASALVALGLGLAPGLIARRSWRKFSYREYETHSRESGSNTVVKLRNGGSREVVDVTVLISHVSGEPGDWTIDHMAASETQQQSLPMGSWEVGRGELRAAFTDWRGKRFIVVARSWDDCSVRPANDPWWRRAWARIKDRRRKRSMAPSVDSGVTPRGDDEAPPPTL